MAYNSKKLAYGVGRKGNGVAKTNGRQTKAYIAWKNMLRRCYCPKSLSRRPTYIGCSVCDEWLYFPTFQKWFDENHVDGFQLDKDLLVSGNKIYGSDTCVFVPPQINSLFTDCGRARGGCPIGVCFEKRVNKFKAQVTIDGKRQHLGYFDDPEEAHNTYMKAKKENVIRIANEWKDKISDKLYIALIKKAGD